MGEEHLLNDKNSLSILNFSGLPRVDSGSSCASVLLNHFLLGIQTMISAVVLVLKRQLTSELRIHIDHLVLAVKNRCYEEHTWRLEFPSVCSS